MLDAALTALGIMTEPTRLVFLFSGVLIGLGLGVIPGLGGIVGMALLLPFTFTMDPYSAFAFLLGMGSVTTTSDTIPAVLFGVPGTTGSAATILDGHPMAKKGEAGRAFGAGCVDGPDVGMGHGGIHNRHMRQVRHGNIVDIGTPTRQKSGIFGAQHRLANPETHIF